MDIVDCLRVDADEYTADGNLIDAAADEIELLRGVVNLLADKLACHTGYPAGTEIGEAEAAQEAGGESWDSIRRMYVDEDGRKLKSRHGGESEGSDARS